MRNWLKEARLKKNLSRSELSDMLEVSISLVGKYENGKRTPTVAVAKVLGECLDFEWTKFYEQD